MRPVPPSGPMGQGGMSFLAALPGPGAVGIGLRVAQRGRGGSQLVQPMLQASEDLTFSTQGEVEIIDLTDRVAEVIQASGVEVGQALVFVTSSTSAITTLEYEPGLVDKDLPEALARLFPKHGQGVEYGHQERWQDGNGHSHVRAAFLQPDLTVPVREGRPVLGTWEQIVFVEMDNKPRDRRVVVNCWGTGSS